MMESMLIDVLILMFFLLLSTFFSGSETALFSLKKSDLMKFGASPGRSEKLIARLMLKPQSILITILMGNLFVNLVISSFSTRLMLTVWGNYGHFIAIALVTPVIIILCEISPKTIAIHNPGKFSKRVITPLKVFHWLLMPLRKGLELFIGAIMGLFKLHPREGFTLTEEELDMAIRLGEDDGVIAKEEGGFLKNVLRFSRKEAENIMVPRNKAVFIPYNASIPEAIAVFMDSGMVRAPVYREDFDNVVGVLDFRDLIPYKLGYKKAKTVNKLLKSVHHYPASKELGELLTEFLEKKLQLAVVVDEYGGTAGVVTLTGILKELLGKEFSLGDEIYKPDVRKVDERTSVVNGDMQIDDFNVLFREIIETKEAETIGGYIIEKLGHFPKKDEAIALDLSLIHISEPTRPY